MHDRLDDFKDAVDSMNDAQKRELIEYLSFSLSTQRRDRGSADALERQRQTFLQLQRELVALPKTKDPYAHLGHSNEAHDKIIYDLEQK